MGEIQELVTIFIYIILNIDFRLHYFIDFEKINETLNLKNDSEGISISTCDCYKIEIKDIEIHCNNFPTKAIFHRMQNI